VSSDGKDLPLVNNDRAVAKTLPRIHPSIEPPEAQTKSKNSKLQRNRSSSSASAYHIFIFIVTPLHLPSINT